MIQLDLTDEERQMFSEILESALSDLRMEIADTDRQGFRDHLKQRKQVIVKALDALGSEVVGSAT